MHRILPLTLALLLAGCGDSPEARLARAEQAFAGHDYRAAQLDLAAVIQAQPGNAAALALAARNHLAQGDGVAAQAALGKLAALGREPADFALLAGEAALLRGQPKAALAAVAQRGEAEAFRIRALAALMQDDPESAAGHFAAGAAAPGDKVRLYADHARLLLRRGDLAGAKALVAKALTAGPAQLDALLADAQLAVANGDLARALKRYERAARGYPGNLAALTGKAAVLGDLGRAEEFAALVAQIAALAPGDPTLAWLEARGAAQAGDWAKVRATLQPHEAALAERDDAAVLYAEAQLRLGQHAQARARLEPLVRRAPGHARAALLLAEAELAGGDAAAAVATLRSRAERPEAPPEVVALMAKATRAAGDPAAPAYARRAAWPAPQALAADLARGDAALKAGDWQGAAAAYRRILGLTDGSNPMVLNNLAFAEHKLGNARAALALALRALRHAPDDPAVMDTAGWLLVETGGDRNRALDLLRAAARKAPGNPTIAAHLAAAERG